MSDSPGDLPNVTSISETVLRIEFKAAWAPLGGVNAWAIRDNSGFAIVDTGFGDKKTRAQWDALLSGNEINHVTRIICTHFHPDHIGQVAYLQNRFNAPFSMTDIEWNRANQLGTQTIAGDENPFIAHLVKCGYRREDLGKLGQSWGGSKQQAFPANTFPLHDNAKIDIGGQSWDVRIGAGHSPAPAVLFNRESQLVIIGDQILSKITPHIGVEADDPNGDPLGQYLHFLARAEDTPEEWLMLPGHGTPFSGAPERAREISAHHDHRLNQLSDVLTKPKRCIEVIKTLFGRELEGISLVMGLTEAHAHLNHLVKTGRAKRTLDNEGCYTFQSLFASG